MTEATESLVDALLPLLLGAFNLDLELGFSVNDRSYLDLHFSLAMALLSCRAVSQSISISLSSVSVAASKPASRTNATKCGSARLQSSLVAGSQLGTSSILSVTAKSKVSVNKVLGVRAAVGADNVVTEPATSIKFALLLTVPDSSNTLTFLGAGVREKQIAFLKVKVYAVGVYAQPDVAASLASWKGKSAADLVKDEALFQELAQAPVEKALQIKLARDVDGATFWGALDEALVPRLTASGAGADGDAALAEFGNVFKNRSLQKGYVITLTWVQPSTLRIAVAESEAANLKTEASIESKALLSALYDVFLGTSAVSPSAKAAVAEGISKLP